jgi:putative PIN family toxin of toxin-antitoxin system
VLDTNVVVSAHLKQNGLERFVLDLALSRAIALYLSEEILEEYDGVLRRSRFGIAPERVKDSLKRIKQAATFVQPKRIADLPLDPDDNKFLDCAAEAGADYLVTGNKRHFPHAWGRTRVVSARELLQELIPTLKGRGD